MNERANALIERFRQEDEDTYSNGMRQLTQTAEGRNVIFRLITDSGLWDTSPYSDDAKLTAFHLGRQEMAREFLRKLNEVDPTVWPAIQLEMVEVHGNRQQMLDAIEQEDEEDG